MKDYRKPGMDLTPTKEFLDEAARAVVPNSYRVPSPSYDHITKSYTQDVREVVKEYIKEIAWFGESIKVNTAPNLRKYLTDSQKQELGTQINVYFDSLAAERYRRDHYDPQETIDEIKRIRDQAIRDMNKLASSY